jgi:hypothetical protein
MQTISQSSPAGKSAPQAFYAHLDNIEGALTKVKNEILFMAWESGEITTITSYKGLTVLGEIGLADTQTLHEVLFGGYAAICTSRN